MRKCKGLQTAVAVICACVVLFTGLYFRADAAFTAFNQNDYGNISYGNGTTLKSSGCGAVAFMNCVYYLTGKKLDPAWTANYSISVGARQYGHGTSVRILAEAFVRDYGGSYQLRCPGTYGSLADAKKYVGSGRACICAIVSGSDAGHYIVLAEYDKKSDRFFILDANPRTVRNTWPDGTGWLSASRLYDLYACKFTHLEYYGGAFSYDPTTTKPTTTAAPTTTKKPTTTDEYWSELQAGNVIPRVSVTGDTVQIRHTQEVMTFEQLLEEDAVLAIRDWYWQTDLFRPDGTAAELQDAAGTGSKLVFSKEGSEQSLTVVYMGDVTGDGKSNSQDARLLLRHAAKLESLPEPFLTAADTDGDGSVNSQDARKVLRFAAKLTLI